MHAPTPQATPQEPRLTPAPLTEPCAVISTSRQQVDIEISMPAHEGGPDEAPKFTMPLRDMTINDGEKASLKVCFQGRPSPTITWFFNSKSIQPTTDFKVSSQRFS